MIPKTTAGWLLRLWHRMNPEPHNQDPKTKLFKNVTLHITLTAEEFAALQAWMAFFDPKEYARDKDNKVYSYKPETQEEIEETRPRFDDGRR